MAAPATPAAPAVAYNDGAIPFGSRYELFIRTTGASSAWLAWYFLESIKPSRPSKKTERPGVIGGPNGFALVAAQETLSAKAQLATQTTETLKVGDWFQDSFDPSVGTVVIGLPATAPGTKETWVIESTSDAFEMNGYWYQELTLIKAHSAPVAPA